MNIVYLGAPITVNLFVGQTIAINTTGTVTVECVSGLGLTDGATIGSIHGSATYGPFSAVGVARITATVRDGAYEVSDGQPIPIDTVLASSGQTVLDDASRAVLVNSLGAAINWKRSNTKKIRASLAGAYSRDFRSRWIFTGDSSFAGTGADNNGLVNARHRAWIKYLGDMLTASGYQAAENWVMSGGGTTTLPTLKTYDTRFDYGSTPTYNASYPGLGGQGGLSTGTDTVNGWFKNTARASFDTVDLLYMRAAGTGALKVEDQAATVVSAAFSTTGSNSPQEATFTFAANSTAAKLTTTGTNCVLYGIGTRNAANPGIEMINAGISGIDLAYFNVNPATGNNWCGPRAAMPVLFRSDTKNVLFVGAGYNDINSFGKTLAQTQQMLRDYITNVQAFANPPDIVLVLYTNLNSGPGSVGFDAFYDGMISVATTEFDLPVIDQRAFMYSSADAISYGIMAADGLHNRAGGQAMTAKLINDALMYARSL